MTDPQPEISEGRFCPNCGEHADSDPIDCPVCGYRDDMAGEYFWLYVGGGLLGIVGIVVGVSGVFLEGGARDGWVSSLHGWFPLGPWSWKWHWLSCVVSGMCLTLIGMGFTRRFRSSFFALLALAVWESIWVIRELVSDGPSLLAIALLVWEIALLALAARLGLALHRVPHRDVAKLQREARRRREEL